MQMKNPCLPSIVLKERLSHVRFEKLSQVRYSTCFAMLNCPCNACMSYVMHTVSLA